VSETFNREGSEQDQTSFEIFAANLTIFISGGILRLEEMPRALVYSSGISDPAILASEFRLGEPGAA
jgi:hypothetical protein